MKNHEFVVQTTLQYFFNFEASIIVFRISVSQSNRKNMSAHYKSTHCKVLLFATDAKLTTVTQFLLPLMTLAGRGSSPSSVEASFDVYSTGKISTLVDII
jgi:hypothetical protein